MERVGTNPNRGRRAARSGSVLVVVLAIAGILAITGTGLLSLGLNSYRRAVSTSQEVAARSAADAGIAQAVFAMKSYDGIHLPAATNEALPGSTATYSYAVSQNPDGTYSATATGTSGTVSRMASSKLKASSTLWSAVKVKKDAILGLFSEIGPVTPGRALTVQTNSVSEHDVLLILHSTITGDVVVGPGGNPATVIDTDPGSSITGTASAATQAVVFPAVAPPSGLPDQGNVTISSPQVITSNRQYGNLTIQDAEVQIEGEIIIYVSGIMNVISSARLVVRDGSSLTLYVGGIFNQMGGTIKEVNLAPEKLQIYGTSTCVLISFSFDATAYAAIYAPAALCSVSASRLTGVFSGGALALTIGGHLHYNPSVDGHCLYGTTFYAIERWSDN